MSAPPTLARPAARADSATRARPRPPARGRGRRARGALTAYLLLTPNLAVFTAFMFLPLVLVGVLSLQRYAGFGTPTWVGADNYRELLADEVFWRTMLNTVGLGAATIPTSLAVGLGVAVLLNRRVPGRGLLRAVYYLPYVLSGVVIGIAGKWIFNENTGVINNTLDALGLPLVPWQSRALPALLSVAVMLVWTWLGFCMVVYLAALQGVPRDYLEAAAIDGAGRWQAFRHVTLPLLRPTTFFLVVYLVIQLFLVFDVVYVMTGGGPGNATELLNTYAYANGFESRRQGYAAAVGVVIYVVLLAVTALWWRARRGTEADL